MKMDTPDKTQITPPLSKFEDSPVFKYIDSLSPIELAKSGQTNNAFSSLAFLSPSSLFPSPQINCHSESRFPLKRHHFLADSNSRVLPSGNESNTSEGALKAVEQSELHDEQLVCLSNDGSSKGIDSNLHGEQSDLAAELPRTSRYGCGSPSGNLEREPCDDILENTSLETAGQESSPFQRNREGWKEMQRSFENERDLRKIRRIKPSEESAGCGWVAIDSDVADMLTVNTSIILENTDGQDSRMEDSRTTSFISNTLQFLLDSAKNLENAEAGNHQGSCKQNELGEPVTEQTSGILSTSLADKLVVADLGLKKVDEGKKCNQSSRQRSIRRRCLVFEKSPGFGLHLNSLPNISKAGQDPPNKSILSSMKRGEVTNDNGTAVTENSSETPATGGNDADHNTPEMKSKNFEVVEESASCKRCNCKRSKCLKLYCDCFAAGLYCIEPCLCLDCFNKPTHENVVLETRKQIESRNPQAFAPKVIRSTGSVLVLDSWGENNKTPASARHKRGCNCKRSSCLKKYCECFQAGVGCSPSCRCEGCKNSFGRKDGCVESESDTEGLEARERNGLDKNSHDIVIHKKAEDYRDLSVLPDISSGKLAGSFPRSIRSSQLLCTTQEHGSSDSSSCQSKFDSNLRAIPEDETPEVKHECLPCVLKPNSSPNCKRVSPPLRGCSSPTARRSKKLILKYVPPFPPFSPQ